MSKTSEELAVDIVSKVIESKQIHLFDDKDETLSNNEVICNLLKDVYKTIEDLYKSR